jgi:hypothetical protein
MLSVLWSDEATDPLSQAAQAWVSMLSEYVIQSHHYGVGIMTWPGTLPDTSSSLSMSNITVSAHHIKTAKCIRG